MIDNVDGQDKEVRTQTDLLNNLDSCVPISANHHDMLLGKVHQFFFSDEQFRSRQPEYIHQTIILLNANLNHVRILFLIFKTKYHRLWAIIKIQEETF